MIDEQDLYALGDSEPGSPVPQCRPVGAVLARGTRLRRRRHAVRAAGASTVVVGLVGTGLFVLGGGRSAGHHDVEVSDEPSTTTTEDVPSAPPPPPPTDCDLGQFSAGEHMLPADVPDAMRVLPSWTPDDATITHARGEHYGGGCHDTAPYPADDALDLAAVGEDGAVTATISVSGPLARSFDSSGAIIPGSVQTELRGQPTTYGDDWGRGDYRTFAWTESDGWSWELRSNGPVDEATLRAVGEALVLDSSPEGDEPPATLAPDAIPAGFSVVWQTLGTPTPGRYESTMWVVVVGGSGGAVSHGIECHIQVNEIPGDQPFGTSGRSGNQPVTVNGQPAYWHYNTESADGLASTLSWELAPGVVATTGCVDWDGAGTLPLETIVQFAESVVPIAADDPRIPPNGDVDQ